MQANQRQAEHWNGAESVHYVDHAERYDRQLAPFADALLQRAAPERNHAVLDVGCGCGATTILAARVARTALGVDLSRPLLDIAVRRARAATIDNAEFMVADAQTHSFARGAFDLVISQFGLMFFDDPTAAFTNLRDALAPDGRAALVCWQGLEANEWLTVVADEVARHTELPQLGGLDRGPGMFALADPDEIAALLDASGFTRIELEGLSPAIVVGGGGTVAESTEFLVGTGMVRGLLDLVGPDERGDVMDAIGASLDRRYEPGVGVRLGTGAWLVSCARAPS